MNKHMVIIDSTARTESLTQLVEAFYPTNDFMVIQLDHHPIYPIGSTDAEMKLDQFNTLVKLLSRASKITLATKLIWGDINGRSKVFLDRFSGIQEAHELKKKWFGMPFNVIATGSSSTTNLSDSTFRSFSNAFDLKYEGLFYWPQNEPAKGDLFEEEKNIYLSTFS